MNKLCEITALVKNIACWYDINEQFVQDILSMYIGDWDYSLTSIQELLLAYPEKKVQLEYAFSTNIRGYELSQKLIRRGIINNNVDSLRYLDVGCAYGGFLKAFSDIGYSVYGVEFDSVLSNLAQRYVDSYGIGCNIINSDFLSDTVVEEPSFDLITCNDVIEHVLDPERCMLKIYNMLKPGGVAYIETVNKLSLRNILSDIHFQIFGLNLLDHYRAKAVYTQLTGSPAYGVSDFYEIDWYLNLVKRFGGAAVEVVAGDLKLDYRLDLSDAFKEFARWEDSDVKKLDMFLVHEIRREFFTYMERYFSFLRRSQEVNNIDLFQERFSDPLIRLVLKKSQTAL